MVDELTPNRGVDSDDFPGYSILSVAIPICAVCITVVAPYMHLQSTASSTGLTLTALINRYSVLPVWTSAGDTIPSTLQAPSRTPLPLLYHQPYLDAS